MDSTNNQNNKYKQLSDEIVISGFSGRLPESANIQEFRDNLYNGVDMVNDEPRRWPKGLYDLPTRIGKIKDENLESFDHIFFGMDEEEAECTDPQMRMLLESTHEAIIDAGYNPQELRGSRTGVYIGISFTDVEQYWCADPDRANGYGLTGCARAMFANRISFAFDFNGPSYLTDSACSSSVYAMAQAFADLKSGHCDAAIVAGAGIILKPTMSLQFNRLTMLSVEGKCKAFDESGAGYVRSDGCVVILMQKASAARRVYSTVLNVRTNSDGSKEQGITFPDGRMQNRLISETYDEIGLNPADVVYVEAHGTGTKAGDPQEINSITDFFCKDRKTPLLIGSVKSNMGHSEPAAGVCSIAKVLLAMEEGVIPGNLHYKSPNTDLYGLVDGRLRVVDRNMPWNGGIIGLNSFGFGGANAHVIMKSNPKPKLKTSSNAIPRLNVVSGRTREAVDLLLNDIEKNKDDEEYLNLVNKIHLKCIPLHGYRGYTVITDKETTSTRETIESNAYGKRPVWFIYTGMGCQWPSMAKDLMELEVFRNTINRCADALRPEGVDLIEILTKSDESLFQNVLHSAIGISTVQIGLTDVLTHLGITPDGIVGHSVGELGCAYGDGCLTVEEAALCAYWRARSIIDSDIESGMMAAVGLSWEEVKARLPSDITAACHNAKDSVTISGPIESVTNFVKTLTKEGIFAKAVNSSGYAFHSKAFAHVGPKVKQYLDRVIVNPKNRSSRWFSTSIPEDEWHTSLAKQNSGAYIANNVVSPVLFHKAVQRVPKNAICIEIAPTGLLQAILKRSLGVGVTNLSLMKRGHENNFAFLLSNIGKLYAAGTQPDISKLYRPISYPVGRGTPMLNSKVGWDHSQRFMVPKFGVNSSSGTNVIDVNLSKETDAYLAGHEIDGRVLFPTAGYITLAWCTFAKILNSTFDKTPVVLKDVVFHRVTVLPKDDSVKFSVNFFEATPFNERCFEIGGDGSLLVSGKIHVPEDVELEELPLDPINQDESGICLNSSDIYKELRLRGYDYSGKFRSITESDSKVATGKLRWDDNWVSFIDAMLQFSILGKDLRDLHLTTRIERVVFNPSKHLQLAREFRGSGELPVYMYNDINVIKSGGVELRGLNFSSAPRRLGTQSSPMMDFPLKNYSSNIHVEHAYVDALNKGDLSRFAWIESPLSHQLPDPMDQRVELCTVYYAAINLRDVMLSSGEMAADTLPGDLAKQDCTLGLEFSGRDSNGKRIMAMVRAKSLATTCVVQRNMIWEVPSDWTMEQASTVPYVYSTAFYALVVRGEMKNGESILIHAGSDDIGQAAISVALHHGLTVYTTVDSNEKRDFLKEIFPKLIDANISNSRDTSFEQMVMRATKGRGVDLVLNSLVEEKLQASIRCLGLNGRFLQIGKFDLNNNSTLGMSVFLKNATFHGIMLDSATLHDETIETVVALVGEGIKNGSVHPLPTNVFDDKQVEQAFRFMASGKYIGKVVVKVRDEEKQDKLKPSPKLIPAISRTYMHNGKSYIIIGGLSDFGLELANWLVSRGAMKLILTSCSGIKTGYQSLMIRRWRDRGVEVAIDTNDVSTLKGAHNLLKESNQLGPVGGIFNLPAVLHGELLCNQKEANLKILCEENVDGTRQLDVASRELCTTLDHFVCFSCISSGRGNIRQTNFGLTNLAEERICGLRQAAGLPGTVIQWDAFNDSGGLSQQRIVSCLQTMDQLMRLSHRKAECSGVSSGCCQT